MKLIALISVTHITGKESFDINSKGTNIWRFWNPLEMISIFYYEY